LSSLEEFLSEKLEERKGQQRYRARLTLASSQDTNVQVSGKHYLNFCSNDYLGLANHPKIQEAMIDATRKYGVGSGASHLVCGHSEEHHALEHELAEFTGRDRALLFSTGYMANMGVIAALVGRSDQVFEDKLNHASLLDGGILSRAKLSRYRHNDLAHLSTLIKQSKANRKLIVTDSVFSMDGDLASLDKLADYAKKEKAWLMVDDAHGFGVLGQHGGGAAEHFSLNQDQLPILVGTFGKSFGTFGAFVAGSENLIEALIQFARTYIYTTAIPPSLAAASRASLSLLKEEDWRRDVLSKNICFFRLACAEKNLQLMPSNSPIQPVFIGRDKDALAVSESLKEAGILVSAIRPPTVPEGTARLRVTLSATHKYDQIEQVVSALSKAVDGLGQS